MVYLLLFAIVLCVCVRERGREGERLTVKNFLASLDFLLARAAHIRKNC